MNNAVFRFAPSPTGLLHIGNIRIALLNFLYARKLGAKFILRFDDTDLERSKPYYIESIERDLKWLGITSDQSFKQSGRMQRYNDIKEYLISNHRLYPCYETPEELDLKRKIALNMGKPPIYDRAALNLTNEQIANFRNEGRQPHYRFMLSDSVIKFEDDIKGELSFISKNVSDPVVIRGDGTMTYLLCSAIDDIDYNITNVVRGEDHVTNTAIQIDMMKAINPDHSEVRYGHLSLIKSKDDKLSKRTGGFDIESLYNEFIDPMAINCLVASLGSSKPVMITKNMDELIQNFDIKCFGRAPANYDKQELLLINHKVINISSYDDIVCDLDRLGLSIDKNFWDIIKGNLFTLADIKHWHHICYDTISQYKDLQSQIRASNLLHPELLGVAINCLPDAPWDENTWGIWIDAIKAHTDLRGAKLFKPLRMALTGNVDGPELKHVLPIIGRQEVLLRLRIGNAT